MDNSKACELYGQNRQSGIRVTDTECELGPWLQRNYFQCLAWKCSQYKCVWLKEITPFLTYLLSFSLYPCLELCVSGFLSALKEMIVVHSKWTLVVVALLNKRQMVCDRQGEESPGGSCQISREELYQALLESSHKAQWGVEKLAGTENHTNGNTGLYILKITRGYYSLQVILTRVKIAICGFGLGEGQIDPEPSVQLSSLQKFGYKITTLL